MSDLEDNAKLAAEYVLELATSMGGPTFARTIYKAMPFYLPKGAGGRPPIVKENTLEANRWRVRLMIFNHVGDLAADTMPEQMLADMPDIGLPTLAAVGAFAAEAAASFHAEAGDPAPEGLDEGTLSRRILSLRVNLSRSKGTTWWKLPYNVGGRRWRINVRVHRATEEDNDPPPPLPVSSRSEAHRREAPAGAPEQRFSSPTD